MHDHESDNYDIICLQAAPTNNVDLWIESLEDMIRKKKQSGDDLDGMAAIHYTAGSMFQVEQPNAYGSDGYSNLEAKQFLLPW